MDSNVGATLVPEDVYRHAMDYNNNAVGRLWAAEGVSEVEILPRVRRDRVVIREAR